jgi:hypothetical protein
MIANKLSLFLLLSMVGLLGVAGYLTLRSDSEFLPPFVIEEPEHDLGELAVGVHDVIFRLTNPAEKPRRVIGLAEG